MQTTVRIADVSPEATETATETRAALTAWIESIQDKLQEPHRQATSKETRDIWKALGQDLFISTHMHNFQEAHDGLNRLLLAFSKTLTAFQYYTVERSEEYSYWLEGICNGFSRAMHEAGLKWTPEAEYKAYLYPQVPMYGSGHEQEWSDANIGYSGSYGAYYLLSGVLEHHEYELDPILRFGFKKYKEDLQQAFTCVQNKPSYRTWRTDEEVIQHLPQGFGVMFFRYTDTDGDWVAGFLNPKDMARYRFSRKRLGAFLTDAGYWSEEEVRAVVERAKGKTAAAQFVLYPNDTPFDDIYTMDGVRSCMADGDEAYNSDGIHPTHVYSSAYMGCGDNGLALFTAQTESGALLGRGIWSRRTNSIVRWYGLRVPERTLIRLGVDTSNGDTLKGAWLGVHKFDNRVVHPYVDGNYSYGKLDENRIYIKFNNTDGIELCKTEGSSYCNGTVWCEDDQEYHDRDECTHHEIQDVYTYSDDWRCPATGEWHDPDSRIEIMLNGEREQVSQYAIYKHLIWETDPTYEMIEDDQDYQDYDPESDDEYEYSGEQNYTM